MSTLNELSFNTIVRRGIEIASRSFEVKFSLKPSTPSVLLTKSPPSEELEPGKWLVKSEIYSVDQVSPPHSVPLSHVEFLIQGEGSFSCSFGGDVPTFPKQWMQRLADAVTQLIQQDIEIVQQEELLTDYASQISRDFEELVWTRELAKRIQQTDIRNSLSEFVDFIFPTLMETVQAAQIVLIQYNEPLSDPNRTPALHEMNVRSQGESIASLETIEKILSRYAERGRRQPVVSNQCGSLGTSELKCFILVPIQVKHEEFGWILALNREENVDDLFLANASAHDFPQSLEFGSFEAGLMQSTASFLASHANNTALFNEQEGLLIGIVRALVNAIDAKDHYTCGHSDRVAALARRLAEQMHLEETQCEEIYLAGLLHDIGKIGVPDSVLLKKGSLNEAELSLLRQHPVIGYHVLKHLKKFADILPGVLHHHEALDGSGYPNGLVGEEIPLQARIIAVADALDAMTSDRPYRLGMPFEKAMEILLRNHGPQWDPYILETLDSVRGEIRPICNNSSTADTVSQAATHRLQKIDQIFHTIETRE